MIVKILPTKAVVNGVGTQFTTTGPFTLLGDDFKANEYAHLLRLGPSGEFRHATNKDGRISVTAYPNTIYVEANGTFQIDKGATHDDSSVGYEEA